MDCCAHEGPDGGDARFDIQQVADGVHVAVAAPAYKVNCNTAIIETDDGLIVVDTHSKPSAARVIVDHLRDLSPQPVRYVVNTHFHWDHWHGNEVYPKAYPGAEIVTNQITREAMVQEGAEAHPGPRPPGPGRDRAARGRARRGARPRGAHPSRRADLRLARAYLGEVTALEPALPTIAFEGTMKLYRRDREIHLLHLGRAHTEGDVFVYLPKEKVVITGDARDRVDAVHGRWLSGGLGGRRSIASPGSTSPTSSWGTAPSPAATGSTRSAATSTTWSTRFGRRSRPGPRSTRSRSVCPRVLGPIYEKPFSVYGDYRPWRLGLLGNIERTYAMVS